MTTEQPRTLNSRWGNIKSGISVVVWTFIIRLGTILINYVVLMVTTLSIIPMVGAYLHQQSNSSVGDISSIGGIALWLVPFLFIVGALFIAEITWMRWLWRQGSRRIRRLKTTQNHEESVTQKSKNRKNKGAK